MKRLLIPLLSLALLLVLALAGCSTETQTLYAIDSIAEIKSQGWPFDNVAIDTAKVSSFLGGVYYNETQNQWEFAIWDETADYQNIIIMVEDQNIDFSPKAGDFITVIGRLEPSANDVDNYYDPGKGWRYTEKSMIIRATDVKLTTAPLGWREEPEAEMT
ncbi:MAG: hypothetical protein QGG15_05080 [Dehalococcoidales bacterium]|jgi:hypothetical protein|nr:hypothetical protein [Dehalococcoidales bacterium]MDP6738375.1 hypothetical protein [Dehalococcoidales bacterium]|tara:strand:- start:641 stop:1120 length:480 start_codon:yes stop_codon:yes gene_type:complete